MESASSIEALKALLSTDSISDDRLAEHHQHLLTESQFISQCSSPQDSEYFLRYGNNTYNTERYLLAIPELEVCDDILTNRKDIKHLQTPMHVRWSTFNGSMASIVDK
ncbi:hypothetical protein LOAG_12594 [Loa loa]|uniref:Uncharacterized protein n=1 Tax=Loa loa TaxID=7209 RepID=A0A1S0TLF3_LOALO|nr:hypothetical protein LOAG_12594 [Loa loa]EFO15912.1 hypothetical protein LOAG_12594 [Loa loa]